MTAQDTIRIAREKREAAEQARKEEIERYQEQQAREEYEIRKPVADSLNYTNMHQFDKLGVRVVPGCYGAWGLWIVIDTCIPIQVLTEKDLQTVHRITGYRVGSYPKGMDWDNRPWTAVLEDAIVTANDRWIEYNRQSVSDDAPPIDTRPEKERIEDQLLDAFRAFIAREAQRED